MGDWVAGYTGQGGRAMVSPSVYLPMSVFVFIRPPSLMFGIVP